MSYNVGDIKWGEPTLGTPSGTIYWSEDVLDGLKYTGGNPDLITDTLASAFDAWEEVASINFEYTSNYSSADVRVLTGDTDGSAGFASYSFDGNPGLSSIFSGTITFSDALTWSPDGSGGTNFHSVALHEIGHVLGLGHVNDSSEIMNPVISVDVLGDGDILGAQILYGTGESESPPTPLPPTDETPPEEETPREPTEPTSDSGGDSGGGGAIGMIVGLLAAVVAMIFGGGGGAVVALAAGNVPDEDPEDPSDTFADSNAGNDAGVLLSDLLPPLEVDNLDHDHGFHEDEDEEELFLF